ncbi:hypothetical protein Ccrd_026488 [Cynara cardunculus var. scolymus]|uniref:Heavy metal-associated domain, HMA n=1 Tax=Cynara cardunculus var. scolymus TaxID=59895 RepID=A0A118H795_CYNCS|nr:hypothetical protein Ccrd_026488 [Cynara cardunculus var. scolymus]
MAPDKVTVMILNVDLKCSCCYKKVKKLLCKFPRQFPSLSLSLLFPFGFLSKSIIHDHSFFHLPPAFLAEIRDQVFDQDKNEVRITVVCCNPDKLRDTLCCKGGKAIQSIEIVEDKPNPKPKPQDKPKPDPNPSPVQKPKPADPPPPPPKVDPPKPADPAPPAPPKVDPPKPADPPPPPPKPKVDPPKPADPPPPPPKVDPPPPKVDPPKPADPPPPPKVDPPKPVPIPDPMPGFCPPVYPVPIQACCQECYQGRSGGPCYDFGYNYGRPVPPPPGPCYDGYGYEYARNRPCYVTRCDYFSEENPQGCSIM